MPLELGLFPANAGVNPGHLWDVLTMANFPANAGVNPGSGFESGLFDSFPRTRGGEPMGKIAALRARDFSPHKRGWTLVFVYVMYPVDLFPAQAGVNPKSTS